MKKTFFFFFFERRRVFFSGETCKKNRAAVLIAVIAALRLKSGKKRRKQKARGNYLRSIFKKNCPQKLKMLIAPSFCRFAIFASSFAAFLPIKKVLRGSIFFLLAGSIFQFQVRQKKNLNRPLLWYGGRGRRPKRRCAGRRAWSPPVGGAAARAPKRACPLGQATLYF